MRKSLVLLAFAALAACSPPAANQNPVSATGPISTPIHPVTDTYFGVTVSDPYRWLENAQDPEVHNWAATQTAHARSYLDALPYRRALGERLMQLISQTSPSYSDLKAAGTRVFALYSDPAKQQPLLTVMGQDLDGAHATTVIDPNAMDASGAIAIDWYQPSPDGSKVAVSLSRGGSEDGDLHIFDVGTGHEIGAAIPHVQYPTAGGAAAWSDDGQSIWYTHFPGGRAFGSGSSFLSNGLAAQLRAGCAAPITKSRCRTCRGLRKSLCIIAAWRTRSWSPSPMAMAASSIIMW